jgi:potassium-transporting ATPase KdpC subunit
MNEQKIENDTIRHLGHAVTYTIVSVILLGLLYPLAMTGLSELLFPAQANGSMVYRNGPAIGSDIIGQLWTKPQYFHGRPSAAGSGYDPTSTGGTNLGPTSKKLIDATAATIMALKKDNPNASSPIPMDLVTSSASGIDPDISPEAAYYQTPRVATARHLTIEAVRDVVAAHLVPRMFGFLGEPHVNVMQLNLALDGAK